MTRKEIKRALALLRAQAETGKDMDLDLPAGFCESFEGQPEFRGWANYHVTWDVDPEDAWKAVSLEQSLVADWHDALREVVPVLGESDG